MALQQVDNWSCAAMLWADALLVVSVAQHRPNQKGAPAQAG
jgi:hypothetical protein